MVGHTHLARAPHTSRTNKPSNPYTLVHTKNLHTPQAFAVYRCMMRPLAPNFQEGLAAIAGQLRQIRSILAALEAPLLRHLEQMGAASFETAFQMLLLMFRRELTWADTFTFWEALWAAEAVAKAPLRAYAVAALFSARRREMMALESLEDLVIWVNGGCGGARCSCFGCVGAPSCGCGQQVLPWLVTVFTATPEVLFSPTPSSNRPCLGPRAPAGPAGSCLGRPPDVELHQVRPPPAQAQHLAVRPDPQQHQHAAARHRRSGGAGVSGGDGSGSEGGGG